MDVLNLLHNDHYSALYAGRRAGPLGDEVVDSFRDVALDRAQAQNWNAAFF